MFGGRTQVEVCGREQRWKVGRWKGGKVEVGRKPFACSARGAGTNRIFSRLRLCSVSELLFGTGMAPDCPVGEEQAMIVGRGGVGRLCYFLCFLVSSLKRREMLR